ncbi:pre-mRNA splicing factor [Reticulomyxa filosa]|uniref:Pre-mRNA-splicing factor 18 n=1 Tax=Reticulomyxa filosa TaxID=46433 RepID=X6MA35_RETFI|nr:pre-mRNA splicing factor [Reticulomyxa filosa]|eukprot:ETO10516.1 pre-mRNA splicing factor [Reticulomyxa filosa]
MDILSSRIEEFKKEEKLKNAKRLTLAEKEEIELSVQKRDLEEQKKQKQAKRRQREEKDGYIVPKKLRRLNDGSNINDQSSTSSNQSTADLSKKSDKIIKVGSFQNKAKKKKFCNRAFLKFDCRLSEEEVIRRLRQLRQPIRYFGETDEERIVRLRQLELMEDEKQEGASKGLKNEYSHTIAHEVEKELQEALAMGGPNKTEKSETHEKKKESKYDIPMTRNDFEHSEDYVLYFFKRLLRDWEKSLLQRSEEAKQSVEGKHETMRQKQTRRDIRPLFKQLKNRTVPIDVLDKSEKIVKAVEKRDYSLAKTIFLELAIGNAPWPMGVTMVESLLFLFIYFSLFSFCKSCIFHLKKKKDVMNDETQRKYIHAMERIISFGQTKYPSEDLTKNVG